MGNEVKSRTYSGIKACLFDLDGVIVDTAKYHFKAWKKMANSLGFDFSEQENEQLKGVSRMDSIDLILGWGGITLTLAEKLEWASQKNDWYLEFLEQMDEKEILPGALEFIQDLQKKVESLNQSKMSVQHQLLEQEEMQAKTMLLLTETMTRVSVLELQSEDNAL